MNANELKIFYKKSLVKFGKRKTLLFEVKSSPDKNSVYFLTDRSRYIEIKEDPSVAVEIVNSIGGLSNVVENAFAAPNTKIIVVSKGILRNKTSLISKEAILNRNITFNN